MWEVCMYSLSEKDRLEILSKSKTAIKNSQSGIIEEEIEKIIAATLPPVPGLVRGLSPEERKKVFDIAIQQRFINFIKKNGKPF